MNMLAIWETVPICLESFIGQPIPEELISRAYGQRCWNPDPVSPSRRRNIGNHRHDRPLGHGIRHRGGGRLSAAYKGLILADNSLIEGMILDGITRIASRRSDGIGASKRDDQTV